MKTSDLIKALNRLKVQTGSIACLGLRPDSGGGREAVRDGMD